MIIQIHILTKLELFQQSYLNKNIPKTFTVDKLLKHDRYVIVFRSGISEL
jgi:hypothetical protein